MNEETQEKETPKNTPETTDEKREEEKTSTEDSREESDKSKELQSALAQKDHFREKLEKESVARKELEAKLNQLNKQGTKPALDVEDYIDISTSLEGLDQREKERLAREHKLTGKPLKEIRQDEDFVLWQKAYRDKVEKERQTLTPNSTQTEAPPPKTFVEKLREAKSVDEKAQLLREQGYLSDRARRNPHAGKVKLG